MLVHVIAQGHEFIGEVGKYSDTHEEIKVRHAVKVLYRNSAKGQEMLMMDLCHNNNYLGDLTIGGRSFIVMPLQELGSLAKDYRQARSNLVLNEKKISVLN